NHSPKQLTHYQLTFRDFDRFLEETRRPATLAAITTQTFEAFIEHLKDTPLARPYRGTTQRSIVGVHGHMKDLRAFVRGLSDEQLDRVAPTALHWQAPLTVQFFIEHHPIAHPHIHLESIRTALGR